MGVKLKSISAALTMLASTLVAVIAFAAPAHASCAGPFPTPGGPNKAGSAQTLGGTNPLRYEYYESCGILYMVSGGYTMDLYCSKVNSYGNVWWYGKLAGEIGWMYRGNLGSGANRSAATDC